VPIKGSRGSLYNVQRWFLHGLVVSFIFVAGPLLAAPSAILIPFWDQSDQSNQVQVDHSIWQTFLNNYLDSSDVSIANCVVYSAVSELDKAILQQYIASLSAIDPRVYSRAEQKAYWINLYNALTVQLILKHYPVKSITKLGDNFFRFGPWDDKLVVIQGQILSLNDIEHGILRPIYKDPRIHYAVNCASLGCPDLSPQAYTNANTEDMLNAAAVNYVNHPRGVRFESTDSTNNRLKVSSIYHWYADDFGGTDQALIQHFIQYAKPPLKIQLEHFQGDIDHGYDWSLNDIKD